MTERQIDGFFEAVRSIPADKLDWQPSPGSRSALDQVQEVATLFGGLADAVKARKLEFTPEMYEEWTTQRKLLSDLDQLEKMTREGTKELIEFIRTVRPEELSDTVEMPWPGEYTVADLLTYHTWNMAYHQGQITYIAGLLPTE